MAIIFFLLIAVIVFFVYQKNWNKLVYLLMILIPFFGFIINTIRPYTNMAPLLHDLIIILPLYALFFFRKHYPTTRVLSPELKFIIFLLIGIIIIQTINPSNKLSFIGRLVGIKVWLYYLPFIAIGFHFFEKISDLLKLCKVLSIVAIVPCLIAIAQYFSSIYFDYELTMNFFYTPEVAASSTQNYARFNVLPMLTILRIPSTFTFPTQFSNYLLLSLIPVMTCIHTSKSFKEKLLYNLILVLIILASIASGVRGMYAFIPLFFFYFSLFHVKLFKIILSGIVIYLILLLVYSTKILNLNNLFDYIFLLNKHYILYAMQDFGTILFNNILGQGTGMKTGSVRYVVEETVKFPIFTDQRESYYHKTIIELGFFGLVTLIAFYAIVFREIKHCLKIYSQEKIRVLIASFMSFFLLILTINFKSYHVDLYPINFMFYFILGIILKLRHMKNSYA